MFSRRSKKRMLKQSPKIGRLFLLIIVPQPVANLEAMAQKVEKFVTEGLDQGHSIY